MNRLAALLILAALPAHAETAKTTCYKSGRDTICRTTTEYGVVVQETRCYPTNGGRDTVCDTRR
jgi:hypothetical protein